MQETRGRSAIHEAMIEHQTQRPHLADDDFISARNRLRGDASHAEDGGFGQVDDRGESVHIVHSQIGDGECSAAQIVGQGTPGTGAVHHAAEVFTKLAQILFIGILHDRHKQTAFSVHCHADVDVGQNFNCIGCEAGVHVGELAQRNSHHLCQQVIVARRKAPIF